MPWAHVDTVPLPGSSLKETSENIRKLLQERPFLDGGKTRRLDAHHQGKMFAVSYPTEISFGVQGTGWLFLLSIGKDRVRPGHRRGMSIVRTMRSGPDDLAIRNPEAKLFSSKRVAIVGVGAIGSSIAAELAKNGCHTLDIVDHDVVEPGNSVRWIAGQSAWGQAKAEAVKTLLEREWPQCKINAHRHMIGGAEGDEKFYQEVLNRCDLVVDATAAYGVTLWLGERCRAANIPLVSAMASADLEGGVVALFRSTSGCPRCLEFAWHRGDAPEFGRADAELTIQPPGCSERTFEGGSYDLQELSLQAVRSVLATCTEDAGSIVASLKFFKGHGGVRSSRWQVDPLQRYEECRCKCTNGDASD